MRRNAQLAAAMIAIAVGALAAPVPENPSVQRHVDRALKIAGSDYFAVTARLQCDAGGAPLPVAGVHPAPGSIGDDNVAPSTEVFENLFYVGLAGVGAWAVNTDAGIMLIDALNSTDDVKRAIEPGLRAHGLDPARIRYVILTHGHGDHYGGARYLADTYGARIVASAADWALMESPPPKSRALTARFAPPPKRDIIASDGQRLTLGKTTLQLVLTPGHTPGTMSIIFPVFDRGNRHIAALWGGTGLPRTLDSRKAYLASLARFDRFARAARVDVEISNHGFVDDSLRRMADIRAHPDAPNPFVIGALRYKRYVAVLSECARAGIARMTP